MNRLLVIGLDCAAPRFLFGPDAFDLPTIRRLMRRGAWGRLRSCDPPITIPAWAVMTTGRDPGELGVYGFHERRNRSYGEGRIVSSRSVTLPRVWDVLSAARKRVAIVGVPQTYPPTAVNGIMVSGFLTPDSSASFTYPPELRKELLNGVGEYLPDVQDYRSDDKRALLDRIHAHMQNKFAIASHVLASEPWHFFMMVEMGLDRLHHAFWKYCDPLHPKFQPDNPFRDAFASYYRAIDDKIALLIREASGDTAVMIVSDHGAKALHGAIALNEWLVQEGYLTLNHRPPSPTPLRPENVDWTRTRAWAAGGYCGRIEINLAGREPQGIVPLDQYEALREELITRIEAMNGTNGQPLGNRALKPRDIYAAVNGIAPDLMIYCSGLEYRAAGTVGHNRVFLDGNDTGPDDANHDVDGIFIYCDDKNRGGVELKNASILDIAPTILAALQQPVPTEMQGKNLCHWG